MLREFSLAAALTGALLLPLCAAAPTPALAMFGGFGHAHMGHAHFGHAHLAHPHFRRHYYHHYVFHGGWRRHHHWRYRRHWRSCVLPGLFCD